MAETDPDEAPALGQAEAADDFDSIEVARPGMDAALGQVLGDAVR